MESSKIEQLIDKYFQGETSTAEEKELQNYFSSSEVLPELEHYQPLFAYFSKVKQQVFKPEIKLESKKGLTKWWAIAASIIVLLGIATYGYLNFNTEEPKQDLGTFDNPELAFAATQKALSMLSTHINTGFGSMQYINEYQYSKNLIFKQY